MIWETILRMLYLLEPLVPAVLITAGLTAAMMLLLVLPCSRFWPDDRRGNRWLGLFFGLHGWDYVRLACVWLRFCLCVTLLLPFLRLTAQHYVLYAVPMVVGLWGGAPGRWVGRLLGDAALFAGVLLTELLFSYWQGVGGSFAVLSLYVVLSLFVLLFNIYLFLLELENISGDRKTHSVP